MGQQDRIDVTKQLQDLLTREEMLAFFDFEKNRSHSEACQAPQMQIEQAAGKPAAAPGCRHRDRKNFGLVHHHAGQDEARKGAAASGSVGQYVTVRQHALEIIGKLGRKDSTLIQPALPGLIAATNDREATVRWSALASLEKVGEQSKSVISPSVPSIIECVRDPVDHVRSKAQQVLKKIGVNEIEYKQVLR